MAREMLQPAENVGLWTSARLRNRFPEEVVVGAELRQSFVVIKSQSQSLTWGRDNEISPRMNDRAGVPGLIRWKITQPCRCDPQRPTYRAAAGGFEVGTRRTSPSQHVCAEVGHRQRLWAVLVYLGTLSCILGLWLGWWQQQGKLQSRLDGE